MTRLGLLLWLAQFGCWSRTIYGHKICCRLPHGLEEPNVEGPSVALQVAYHVVAIVDDNITLLEEPPSFSKIIRM